MWLIVTFGELLGCCDGATRQAESRAELQVVTTDREASAYLAAYLRWVLRLLFT